MHGEYYSLVCTFQAVTEGEKSQWDFHGAGEWLECKTRMASRTGLEGFCNEMRPSEIRFRGMVSAARNCRVSGVDRTGGRHRLPCNLLRNKGRRLELHQ